MSLLTAASNLGCIFFSYPNLRTRTMCGDNQWSSASKALLSILSALDGLLFFISKSPPCRPYSLHKTQIFVLRSTMTALLPKRVWVFGQNSREISLPVRARQLRAISKNLFISFCFEGICDLCLWYRNQLSIPQFFSALHYIWLRFLSHYIFGTPYYMSMIPR